MRGLGRFIWGLVRHSKVAVGQWKAEDEHVQAGNDCRVDEEDKWDGDGYDHRNGDHEGCVEQEVNESCEKKSEGRLEQKR